MVLAYLISLCRKHGFLGQQNDKYSLYTFSYYIGKATMVLTYFKSLCWTHGFLSQQNDKFHLHTFPCYIGKATKILAYMISLCVKHMDSWVNKIINSVYILFLVLLEKLLWF